MVQILSSSSCPTGVMFVRNPKPNPCRLHSLSSSHSSSSSSISTAGFNLSHCTSRSHSAASNLKSFQINARRNFAVVKCRQSDYFEQSSSSPSASQRFASSVSRDASSYSPPPSFSSPAPGSSPRVFVGHSIYKGKAALTVEPRAPEFVPLESGAFKVSREGFVLLQFAPASGVRQYDWSRKQLLSLSVAEIGSLISIGARESLEFFHDPNKGRSEEGKVRKVLRVEPLPDGGGYFFNLSVQNKILNVDENINIPISKAEFAVLNAAFKFILPYLLGWSTFADSIRPDDSRSSNNSSRMGDYEWSR